MNYDRGFAYTIGVVLLAIGIFACVPAFISPPMAGPSDVAGTGHVIPLLNGDLMHSFHFNIALSLFYILIGSLGFWMGSLPRSARRYAQIVCVSYAVLAILGCITQTSTLFGLASISGRDVGLHLSIALIAGIFGFVIGKEDWTTIGTNETRGQHLDQLPSHTK